MIPQRKVNSKQFSVFLIIIVVFFILEGTVNYITSDGVPFLTVLQGNYFGEIEILEKVLKNDIFNNFFIFKQCHRQSFTRSREELLLCYLKKDIFLDCLKQFPLVDEEAIIYFFYIFNFFPFFEGDRIA